MPSKEDFSFVATAVLDGTLKPAQGKDLLSWLEFAETNGSKVTAKDLAVTSGLLNITKAESTTHRRDGQRGNSAAPISTMKRGHADHASSRTTQGYNTSRLSRCLPGYEIITRIGSGSMGTVYVARNRSTRRKVAIKVLSRQLQNKKVCYERFYREANILRQVDHPHIVRAFDAGQAPNGQPYLVMEYIEGESADHRLRRLGRLTVQQTVEIAQALCKALEYLHSRNTIHRDLKPENILLSNSGEIKLADFGLAKHLDDVYTTHHETTIGTPLYMSPEQARGNLKLDPRSDIYSLGCNLFHMLTGGAPYPDEHPLTVMTKHLYDPIPWAQDSVPGLPAGLCRVIRHMMLKDRNERYPDIKMVEADLQRVAREEEPLRPHEKSHLVRTPEEKPAVSERETQSAMALLRSWFRQLFPTHALPYL